MNEDTKSIIKITAERDALLKASRGRSGEPSACYNTGSELRTRAGMVAYVRKAAEKHDELCAQAGGVGFPAGMLHNAQAHALRVVAAELAEFYT